MDPQNLLTVATVASAVIALLAVLAAVWGILFTLRATWRQNSANIVLALEKEYSAERRWARVDLARKLQGVRASARKGELLDLDVTDMPLLSWFENIGYLTRNGILDRGMVWNKFFWEIERYYLGMTQNTGLLAHLRESSNCPTLYQELEWLYWQLLEEEVRQNRNRPHMAVQRVRRLSAEVVDDFLAREARLVLDVSRMAKAPKDLDEIDTSAG